MLTQRTKTWNKCAWVLCRWVNLTHTNESFCSCMYCRNYWFASGAAGVPGVAAAAACSRHSRRSVAGAFILAAPWPASLPCPRMPSLLLPGRSLLQGAMVDEKTSPTEKSHFARTCAAEVTDLIKRKSLQTTLVLPCAWGSKHKKTQATS